MDIKIKVVEKDITGILGESVNICSLQLKSPFFDECDVRQVQGYNILAWKQNKIDKRKNKILSILKAVKQYRKDINIIVLPEYAIHYEMINDLKKFANLNNTILISTYYDDRGRIKNKINECYRKNVLAVILPKKKSIEGITKLEKTYFEANFVSDPPADKMKIAKFWWSVGDKSGKLYFQIFICGDFLTHFDKVDWENGGIIIVPMCSSEMETFQATANLCIRPHGKWKTERCVILCNSISLPSQNKIIGGGRTQIFSPYKGRLPRLENDVEGGLIATIKAMNVLTTPTAIPSIFNVVIEDPISFILREERKGWKIEEKVPVSERWVINPKVFTSLGLGTYFTFGRLKNYYQFRSALARSFTKCTGVQGYYDIVSQCLAEEESDALMLLYGGRSDIGAELEGSYFHVEREHGYIKYKGFKIDKEPLPLNVTEKIQEFREDLYKLVTIISEKQVDNEKLKKMIEMKMILGKEEDVFNAEDAERDKKAEYLISIFLPERDMERIRKSCEFFESEIIAKDLINNPNVKDILYSSGGVMYHIHAHYLIRAIGDHWSINRLVLDHIHAPLSKEGIACGTRTMPLYDYLSDREYEALSHTSINSTDTRRMMREITNAMAPRSNEDAILIRRLSPSDIKKMTKIFGSCKKIEQAIGSDPKRVEEKIIRLFCGWVSKKKHDKKVGYIQDDMAEIFTTLAKHAEKILYENIRKKQKEVGRENFEKKISDRAKKKIEITENSGLGTLLMATSIWDGIEHSNPIVNQEYTEHVKNLQKCNADKIRNYFSHREKQFMNDPKKLEADIDATINALLSLIDFVTTSS